MNPILNIDSYKSSHPWQLPPGIQQSYSYIESRKDSAHPRIMFFGLQMFLKKYLSKRITMADVNEAQEIFALHGVPFHREGFVKIVHECGGRLPIEIKALPEGTQVPHRTVLLTITNTHDSFAWLPAYLETALLRGIWYPSSVATNSRASKEVLMSYLDESSDNPDMEIMYKLHDFGARGVSSEESAGIGGCAHLVNFHGTDTISGIMNARMYYNEPMAGHSIAAMEHSTITAWGRDGEVAGFSNMMDHFAKPGAIMASVSDSYDLWNAVKNIWGDTLRQRVIGSGATIVIRPDSGDPITVPTQCINILGEKFGFTTNSKGFKVLPKCVRVIQGDGIDDCHTINSIYSTLLDEGWSADNLNIGQGGGLLQRVTRDTYGFAQKASAIRVAGEWRDIYKDPIGDKGKASKRGRFVVTRERGKWETLPIHTGFDWADCLRTVYYNGELMVNDDFSTIRARSNNYFE
jgi:nicotinamide phosphoribosyltransferase